MGKGLVSKRRAASRSSFVNTSSACMGRGRMHAVHDHLLHQQLGRLLPGCTPET